MAVQHSKDEAQFSNERRPELLFISPVFPLPLESGQCVRIFNLIKACSRDFDVTLVSPPPTSAVDYSTLSRLGVRYHATTPATRPYSKTELISLSRTTGELITPRRMADIAPFREALSAISMSSMEIIFVERGHLAVLAAGHHGKTIVDLDDLEHVRLLREMRNGMPILNIARGLPRLVRLISRETLGLRRFRASIVCSEEDRRRLTALGAQNVFVVPNAADIPPLAEVSLPKKDAVFLGNCHYPPNADAIAVLRNAIIPNLRRTHPNFTVDIIGPYSEEFDSASEGLRARGYVEDLYAELSAYKMLIAPLRIGGGTKVKIVDAMAAGIPVVTSSVGAEGLNLTTGENVMIADDPGSFAERVRDVLRDPDAAQQLAENARAHVEKHFSWANVREMLADKLKSMTVKR